jgi:CheY-like chemotaxis protein
VASHGGTISVASEQGRGTTFTIILPSAESRPGPVGAASEPTLRSGLRVLVVDDQREFRDILGEFLGGLGCVLTVHGTGRGALDELERQTFDVVLTDLLLPGASGWEIARAAKRRAPGCRVIMLSGKEIPEELLEDALVDASLTKPVDLERIRVVIAEVLKETPRADA